MVEKHREKSKGGGMGLDPIYILRYDLSLVGD